MRYESVWIEITPRLLAAALVSVLSAGMAWGQATVGGCQVFPTNNIWNRTIDNLPVHSRSHDYIVSAGLGRPLLVDPSIPFNVVGPGQPMLNLAKLEETDESDPGPFPIPEQPLIEAPHDSHILIVQTGTCKLYELYAARPSAGGWIVGSSAIFDLTSNRLRPDGWTSTDAAGLPVLPGLLRLEEVKSGSIRHALRMTVPKSQRAYVWPARHYASKLDNGALPPMGLRLRLRKDVDLSGFSKDAQVILLALKRYGMFVTDNGQSFFITATLDPWPQPLLDELKQIKSDVFEAVDESELMLNPNSAQAGPLPPFGEVQVEYAPALNLDLSQGTVFVTTLKGDAKLGAVQNGTPGQMITLRICQDAAGRHQFVWPARVTGAMSVGLAAGKCSAQSFAVSGDELFATGPGSLNQ